VKQDIRDAAEALLGTHDPNAPARERARTAATRVVVLAVGTALACIAVGAIVGLASKATVLHAITYALYLVGALIVLVTGVSGGTGRRNFRALRTGKDPAMRLPWQYMLVGFVVVGVGILFDSLR
jgi:uncharacterized membrane protein YidH (DUF202 family)